MPLKTHRKSLAWCIMPSSLRRLTQEDVLKIGVGNIVKPCF